MFKWIMRLAIAAFVLVIVVLLVAVLNLPKLPAPSSHAVEQEQPASEPASAPAPSEDQVLVGATMEGVKKFLDDPDSASFPSISEWSKAPVSAGRWQIAGEVSTKNAFGGRVRDAVAAELIDDGQQVRIVYLKIGDRVVVDVR